MARPITRPVTRCCVVAVLLAGCAVPPPGSVSDTTLTTIAVTPKAGAAPPAARGETALIVRAVVEGGEVAGAACTADSPYFTASFTAPARLLLPDFGGQAPEVRVACRAGDATGTVLARPSVVPAGGIGGWPAVGVSVGGGTGTGGGGGVGVGFSWYGGAAGISTGGGTPARYPELAVPLTPA